MEVYWILLMVLWLPIAGLTFKHFLGQRKTPKRRVIPFPFPIRQGDQLNAYGEPRAFRKVDSAIAARDKRFDWPQP